MTCPSCGAAHDEGAIVCFGCKTALLALGRGDVLDGRFEIRAFLGRGGMGAVYHAHDRTLNEEVALKVIRPDLMGTPETRDRFTSEIKLARRVSHPGVCRIHEYGEDGPQRFFTMELVEGRNLRELIREEGPLPPERACALAAEMADALQAIHAVGIVHRDLKPLNVMVDREGRVRLMDFGIAKGLSAAGQGTGAGYVVGSPEYMSPEQARGRPVDARSDVYALGIVLYEMLTSRRRPRSIASPSLSAASWSARWRRIRTTASGPRAGWPRRCGGRFPWERPRLPRHRSLRSARDRIGPSPASSRSWRSPS